MQLDLLDFIPSDNSVHVFGDVEYNSSSFETPRATKDVFRSNSFGRALVDFCCLHDIHMLNGRFDDVIGELTCISTTCTSIVDYIISSESLFPYIEHFFVLDIDESDHFTIQCMLQFSK